MSLSLEKKLLTNVARYELLLDHSAVNDWSTTTTRNSTTEPEYTNVQQRQQQELPFTHHSHKESHYKEKVSEESEEEESKPIQKYKEENSMCKSKATTISKSIIEPAIMSRAEIHELSVQSKLDVLTQRITHAASVQSARLRKELQHTNRKIAHEVEELGLKAYMHESGATVMQSDQTPETHAQSSARFASNHKSTVHNVDNNKSKSSVQTKSHAMPNNNEEYAFRNIVPVSFNKSGFESLIQWGIVSFDEAAMTLLGPSRKVKTSDITCLPQLPHPLLTSVCAYILNEVLYNNLYFTELWSRLRTHLFNAIYSKELTGQVEQEANSTCDKINDRNKSDINVDNNNNVDTFTNFIAYKPWSELYKDQVALQNELHADIDRLKETLHKRKVILLMASNKINSYLVRSVFVQWRQHTRRVHKFQSQMTKFLSKHHYKYKVHEIFMKWRRITLTDKVNALRREKLQLMNSYEHSQRNNVDAIQALKKSLADKVHELHLTRIKHMAELSQMQESSQLECATLQLALQQTQNLLEHCKQGSHRWERLAKTFHPFTSTGQFQSPSLGLIWAGHRLRGVEETLVLMRQSNVLVKSVFTLTKEVRESLIHFLETWVNFMITWGKSCVMKNKQNSKKKKRGNVSSASSTRGRSRPSSAVNNANTKSVNYVFDKPSRDALSFIEQGSSRAKRSYSAHSSQSSASRKALPLSPPSPPPLSLSSAKNAKEEDTETMVFDKRALLQLIRALRTIIQKMSEASQSNEGNNAPELTNQTINIQKSKFNDSSNIDKVQTNDNVQEKNGSTKENMIENNTTKDEDAKFSTNNNDTEKEQIASQNKNCLYYELLSFLHDCTNEGLQPTLLSYCPYKHFFVNQEYLCIDEGSNSNIASTLDLNPLASVWIVSALLVGFVSKCCLFNHLDIEQTCDAINTQNIETKVHAENRNSLPTQMYYTSSSSWPQELRCAYEHYFTLDKSSNDATTMNTGATSNRHENSILSWYTNNKKATGLNSDVYDTTHEQTRITSFNNIDTIHSGIDTVDDMKVYLGVNVNNLETCITSTIANLSNQHRNVKTIRSGSHDNNNNVDLYKSEYSFMDVDQLIADVTAHEEAKIQETLWHNAHQLDKVNNASSDTINTENTCEDDDDDDDDNDNDTSTYNEKRNVDVAHLTHELHVQRQEETERAIYELRAPLIDLLSPEQIYLLNHLPPPLRSINNERDVANQNSKTGINTKRQNKSKKSVASFSTVDKEADHDVTIESNKSNNDNCKNDASTSNEQTIVVFANSDHGYKKDNVESTNDTSEQDNSSNEKDNNLNQDISSTIKNDDNDRVSEFVERIIDEHEVRRQWLSLARLVVSLMTRLDVMTYFELPSEWQEAHRDDKLTPELRTRSSRRLRRLMSGQSVSENQIASSVTLASTPTLTETKNSSSSLLQSSVKHLNKQSNSSQATHSLDKPWGNDKNNIPHTKEKMNNKKNIINNNNKEWKESKEQLWSTATSTRVSWSASTDHAQSMNKLQTSVKHPNKLSVNNKKVEKRSTMESERSKKSSSSTLDNINNKELYAEQQSNSKINVSYTDNGNDAKDDDSVLMTSTITSVIDENDHLNKEDYHDLKYNITCGDEHSSQLLNVEEKLGRGRVDPIGASMERTLPWIESASPRTHQIDKTSLESTHLHKETLYDKKEGSNHSGAVHGKYFTSSNEQDDQEIAYSGSVNVKSNVHKEHEQQLFASTTQIEQHQQQQQQQQQRVKENTELTINNNSSSNDQSTRTITGFTEPSFLAPLVLPVQRNESSSNKSNKHSKYYFKLHDVYHNQ